VLIEQSGRLLTSASGYSLVERLLVGVHIDGAATTCRLGQVWTLVVYSITA